MILQTYVIALATEEKVIQSRNYTSVQTDKKLFQGRSKSCQEKGSMVNFLNDTLRRCRFSRGSFFASEVHL